MKKFLTLSMLLAATSVFAADVYEIRPCDEFGYSLLDADGNNRPYASALAPITVAGRDLYFNVRLVAREEARPIQGVKKSGSYRLDRIDGLPYSDVDWYIRPLKIGIFVGGRHTYAEMVSAPVRTKSDYGEEPTDSVYLWDVVFHYQVQPGDLGLPIRLAMANGQPVPEEYNASQQTVIPKYEYEMANDTIWNIRYYSADESTTNKVSMLMRASFPYDIGEKPENDTLSGNVSLSLCGFYVKTLDFANSDPSEWEKPNEYWKSVRKGHSEEGRVELKNESTMTGAAEMYLWAVDTQWLKDIQKNPYTTQWVQPSVEMSGANVETREITVAYNKTSGKAIVQSVPVYKMPLATGSPGNTFSFKGITALKGATIVMSSDDDFLWTSGVGYTLVTDNFLQVPVMCNESEPEVRLKRTESTDTYTVTSDYENKLTTMTFEFTEPFTEPVTVTITPKFVEGMSGGYVPEDVLRLSAEMDGYDDPAQIKITIPANQEVSKPIYVFGRGAMGQDSGFWSDKKGQKILFDVDIQPAAAAAFIGERIYLDSIFMRPANPVITNPTALAEVMVTAGEAEPVEISVRDNYTDVNDTKTGFAVMWQWWKNRTGSTRPDTKDPIRLTTADGKYSKFAPDDAGVLYALDDSGKMMPRESAYQPAVPANAMPAGYEDAYLWVVAPNQATSKADSLTDNLSVHVVVVEKPKATVRAYAKESGGEPEQSYPEFSNGKATSVYLGVTIDEQYKSADLYAFLAPTDPEMFKYVEGKCLTNSATSVGIRIKAGELTEYKRAEIKLLDGIAGGSIINFEVILCKGTSSFDPLKIVDDYKSVVDEIVVENTEPKLTGLKMNGWGLVPRDGAKWIESPVAVGTKQVITDFTIADAVADLTGVKDEETGTDERFYTRVLIKESGVKEKNFEFYGDPRKGNFAVSNEFSKTGTATVTVILRDKDMDAQYEEQVVETFYVEVVDQPFVQIQYVADELATEAYIYEDEHSAFRIMLSEKPTEDVDVKLVVTNLVRGKEAGQLIFGNNVTPIRGESGAYKVHITKLTSGTVINVESADGTPTSEFNMSAKVITETPREGDGTRWCDYYLASDPFRVVVQNMTPSLTVDGRTFTEDAELNTSNSPVQVAIGEAGAITWNVSDVLADLGSWNSGTNITVTITDDYGATITNVTDAATHTFTPRFRYAGLTTVDITAKDKDGGSITVKRWYKVKATRMLTMTSVGPSGGSSAPHVQHYRGSGLGEGHVWVNANVSSATGWSIEWNCGLARSVLAIAQGYRVGDIDDGTLNDGNDVPLNPAGGNKINQSETDPKKKYYCYPDENKDSFFYCWIRENQEDGTLTSTIYGGISPEVTRAQRTTIDLPTDPDQEGQYPVTVFDAIFSLEWLPTDNVGDINQDGIPDIYVKAYKFGLWGEEGELTGDDMDPQNNNNDDADFFPYIFTATYAHFIPNLSNTWATSGRAFNAKLEIRGWGDGLNDAYQVLVKQGYASGIAAFAAEKVYEDPNVNEKSTLNELEYDAWLQAGRPADWSPERPTSPVTDDTDGDGLSDGYEYYIWYKAHVGYMDNGEHKYLSGRKYNPADPFNPIAIDSETIARKFDPLTPLGSDWDKEDTDDDGVPDSVEFLIGTNPFDFDSDGDGLPDGYELYITGTDPLMAATDRVNNDSTLNPDNDSMAVLAKEMFWVAVLAGNETKYYCCELGDVNPEIVLDTEHPHTGVIFDVVSGEGEEQKTNSYLTTKWEYYTDDEGRMRLAGSHTPANTWICSTNVEGQVCRGAGATLARGTLIDKVAEDVEYFDNVVQADGTGPWYVAWSYTDGTYARGGRVTADAVAGKTVVASENRSIRWLHYLYFHEVGFDPMVGWFHTPDTVNTVAFTHMDELLTMSFFYRMGTITADQMVATENRTRLQIWQEFSTSPISPDTDGDQMPDGWELYMMGGDGSTPGPDNFYSPLFNFYKIPQLAVRDNDRDGLEWPWEYAGSSSSARYGWEVPFPRWRNKSAPTNPWNADTDGDTILDGEEGGYGYNGIDTFYSSVVASYFLYNESGMAGGGLNPLSVDTDADGLPDPWEAEFHGSYSATEGGSITNTVAGGSNTVETLVGNRCVWNMDGMDGTVSDARLDYDGDGLANWQEYMVGAMRCWRYDDNYSSWGVQTATEVNMPEPGTTEWNEYWCERLLDTNNSGGKFNPHLANGYFDPGVYFTYCKNEWDASGYQHFYMYPDGRNHEWADVQNGPIVTTINNSGDEPTYEYMTVPLHYISCDPREIDSDGDGMDDYYEIFHGMNPLLGAPGATKSTLTGPFNPCDIVYDAYARRVTMTTQTADGPSALNNWWLNEGVSHRPANIKHKEVGGYDFMQHPWLNGIAWADPDGDNIVNQEESIMPNVQAASTYHHTDPTPLWMTDSSYADSLTRRYFRHVAPDGDESVTALTFAAGEAWFEDELGNVYQFLDFDGFSLTPFGDVAFEYSLDQWFLANGWMFSFEENEGFDSDHDFLSDYTEAQGKTKNSSDPQVHDDPMRRQAMWFNGEDAFLQKPVDEAEKPVTDQASAEARQNFLYYTVECWAKPDADSLKNDNQLRTLIERAVWADNSNAGDEMLMRKNFLIGLRNGRWYTKFDSSGTDIQPVEITDGPVATTNWTHVAASFDGSALRIYVNGDCRKVINSGIQPEHGLEAMALTKTGTISPNKLDFEAQYISILVGASAMTKNALVFDNAWRLRSYEYIDDNPTSPTYNPDGLYTNCTTFADYGCFYKGYVDEVRIWDGARDAADIKEDYVNRTRYTFELAAKNREEVYKAWVQGGLRSPEALVDLPPQLMYHWAFDHIAGAILTNDVIKVPAGFNTATNVLNAKAGWSRPADYRARWWYTTQVRSKVYSDCAWVPWINNTVAHLPRFDKTTLDSVYWSENYSGYVAAQTNGYARFGFPRNAEVFSCWRQQGYGKAEYYDSHRDPFFDFYNGITTDYDYVPAYSQDTRWHAVLGYEAETPAGSEELQKIRFASRDRNLCGDDLLPMGGAYPRRISVSEGGMWDNLEGQDPSASDAWAETGNDADNNGLPDWWEEYARANYCKDLGPRDALTWDTTVTYSNGMEMPAWQAYLRDLAAGIVKIGGSVEFNSDYADTRDIDQDRIPDWWEELYGVDTRVKNADEDFDGDGLSNYTEYLISEVFQFTKLDPKNATTDGNCLDYFRKCGNMYFGEMFTDHDQVDNDWEAKYASAANRYLYDPDRDDDEDGWSNFAEAKVGTNPGVITSPGVDGNSLAEYPIPSIEVKVSYHGGHKIAAPLIFQAWNQRYDSDMVLMPDAIWSVSPDANGTNVTKYVGLNPGKLRTYHLGTGVVEPGSLRIEFRDMAFEKATVVDGEEISCYPGEVGDARWYYFVQDRNGELYTAGTNMAPVKVGTIDYATGLVSIDFGNDALQGVVYDSTVNSEKSSSSASSTKVSSSYSNFDKLDLSRSYVRIGWTPVMIETTGNATYYLSDCNADAECLGHVREGLNKFVVFADTIEQNGKYDVGEPFGFVRDVDVGWQGGYFAVELTETSPVFARINLRAGGNDNNAEMTTTAGDTLTTSEDDVAATDRQYWHVFESTIRKINKESDTSMNTTPLSENVRKVRVRVIRSAIDGTDVLYKDENGKEVKIDKRVVLDKYFDLSTRSYLHEGDFLGDGQYDVDWDFLAGDCAAVNDYWSGVTNVTYMIYFTETLDFEKTGGVVSCTNRVFQYAVDRVFDAALARDTGFPTGGAVRPVIDVTQPGYVYTARPTLRWRMQNTSGVDHNSYSCFKIRISQGGKVVYESGYQLTPPKDADGNYVWTMTEPIGTLVKRGGEYTWQIAMFNAKYRDESNWSALTGRDVTTWSSAGLFRVVMNDERDMDDHGYSSIAARVKYAGPAEVLDKVGSAGTVGKVRLQAFKTADFAGVPVAESFVDDAGELADTSHMVANAKVYGLDAAGTYYIRAYIDSNGNGRKDDFESWGAASEPVTITTENIISPTVTVYIEDADTDGDWIPDAYEYALAGWNGEWDDVKAIRNAQAKLSKSIVFTTSGSGVSMPASYGGASMTMFSDTQAFMVAALGIDSETITEDMIREQVEKKVVGDTVNITSLALSPDGSKITLTVAAEVSEAGGEVGKLLGKVYNVSFATSETVTVRIHVYMKPTLATDGWTEVGDGYTATIGRGDATVEVPVTGIDMTSGFYKIEIEQ